MKLEMKKAMVYHKKGPESFYEAATLIVGESDEARFAAKTPTLILPEERVNEWRSRYYDTLITKIRDGKIIAKYLFSLPPTRDRILELAREDRRKAMDVLNEWKRLLDYNNLDLRYVEHQDFISCVIGEKHTLIGWKDPSLKTGAATVLSNEISFYREVFNEIFKKASTDHRRVIQDLRDRIKRPR